MQMDFLLVVSSYLDVVVHFGLMLEVGSVPVL